MSDPGDERPDEARQPAADLLPEVYAELRRLAVVLTGRLRAGQTLQPTALVHEAFLRLVGGRGTGRANSWRIQDRRGMGSLLPGRVGLRYQGRTTTPARRPGAGRCRAGGRVA